MSNYGNPPGPGDPHGQQPEGGQPQYGQPQYGQSPYGQAPEGQNPYGQAPYGQAPGSYGAPMAMTRPSSLDMAVKLMWAGAVIALLNLLSVFVMGDQMRDAVEKGLRDSGVEVTKAAIDSGVMLATGFALIFGLLGAGLWAWMAIMNGKGKKWARIVATVFFAISTISFLLSLFQPQTMILRILSVVVWLVGAAAIFFMYKKESTDYYEAMSRKFAA